MNDVSVPFLCPCIRIGVAPYNSATLFDDLEVDPTCGSRLRTFSMGGQQLLLAFSPVVLATLVPNEKEKQNEVLVPGGRKTYSR